jgi:hypothetical protein
MSYEGSQEFTHIDEVQKTIEFEAKTSGVVARVAAQAYREKERGIEGPDALDIYVGWFNRSLDDAHALLDMNEVVVTKGTFAKTKKKAKANDDDDAIFDTAAEAKHLPTLTTVFELKPGHAVTERLEATVLEHFKLMQTYNTSNEPITREWLEKTFEDAILSKTIVPE